MINMINMIIVGSADFAYTWRRSRRDIIMLIMLILSKKTPA